MFLKTMEFLFFTQRMPHKKACLDTSPFEKVLYEALIQTTVNIIVCC